MDFEFQISSDLLAHGVLALVARTPPSAHREPISNVLRGETRRVAARGRSKVLSSSHA